MEWEFIKVLASFSQDRKLTENQEFFGDFRKRVYCHRVRKEEMQATPSDYLFLGKMSHYKIIKLYKEVSPVNIIYSQWLGYLSCSNDDYYGAEAMSEFRDDPQVNFIYAHTSGHATVEDLQTFSKALNPKRLIPIHTEYGCKFSELFENVTQIDDAVQLEL